MTGSTQTSGTRMQPGAELSIEYWPLDRLVPYGRNARTHSETQIAEIAGSIRAFGFTNPILASPDGDVIAGHGRLAAARCLAMKDVPVIVLDGLSETEIRQLVLADNRIALNAGWDTEMLNLELKDLSELGADLSTLGFSEIELATALTDPSAGHTDEDEVPDVHETAIYRALLTQVQQRAPALPVLAHGYDHPGNIKTGKWIWPHMQANNIPEAMAKKIIAILLDRFNDALGVLAGEFENFTHVNLVGKIGSSNVSWYDALHPRNAGFERAADEFERAIDAVLHDGAPVEERVQSSPVASSVQIRNARQTLEEVGTANEAIVRHIYLPDCYDVRDIDFGPRSQWRKFRDPKVHDQIQDVLDLIRGRDEPETQERILNRVRTRSETSERLASGMEDLEATEDLEEQVRQGNDLKDVRHLLSAYERTRAVGLVQIVSPHGIVVGSGSGFLVSPGLLLTNNHVLQNPDEAARSYVVFDNEKTLNGRSLNSQRFRLTDEIFLTSMDLDYSFVSVEPVNRSGKELRDYGTIPLIGQTGKALKREAISIVQHPNGKPKKVAYLNSYVMGPKNEGIYYTTDTQAGSSGSPVLNTDSQAVALHHRTVPHPLVRGEYLANRGIRISSIFDHVFGEMQAGNRIAGRVHSLISTVNAPASMGSNAEVNFSSYGPIGSEHSGEVTAYVDPTDVVQSGAYEGLTQAELLEAIGQRDGDADGYETVAAWERTEEIIADFRDDEEILESLPTDPDSVVRRIGARGVQFIISHEVSSRAHYERRLKNPILPGGSSGITIGVGYDLGHQTLAEFRQHWNGLLSAADRRSFERCIGRTRSRARAVLSSVRHISIGYETALAVFKRSSLPKYFAMLDRHIDDDALQDLHPDCVAALVSLTFNRGASFGKAGSRFREMRAIKRDLNGGSPQNVPEHLRSMKRLWRGRPNLRGLLRRRDEEAQLFQDGLDAVAENNETLFGSYLPDHWRGDVDEGPVSSTRGIAPAMDPDASADVQFDALTLLYSLQDGDEQSELAGADDLALEFDEVSLPRISWGAVRWVNTFSNNPDYWHLPASADGGSFNLTAALVEHLIELGHYQPLFSSDGKLIVAVRGARLTSGQASERNVFSVEITEQKPNHRNHRCVLATFDRNTGRFSAFRGSTVPNRGGVAGQYNKHNDHGGMNANMLPTGCYDLCVGTHHGSLTVPNVLRLGTGPGVSDALRVTTLRSVNDGVYGTVDFWDNCIPKDNVHPAFNASSADFSSLGCLTIPGTYSGGRHRGQWAKFQEDAAFSESGTNGKRYNLLLTSGMECTALALVPGDADALKNLQRLSHGSRGEQVEKLQTVLGVTVDGDFGPSTRKSLTQFEQSKLGGKASGIYSMRSQAEFGNSVF